MECHGLLYFGGGTFSNGEMTVENDGAKIMPRKYHPCYFCKGDVKEEKVTVDYRWGADLLVVLKDVPAGVCQICGERYFKSDIVKAMEKTALSRRMALEIIEVPVRKLQVA